MVRCESETTFKRLCMLGEQFCITPKCYVRLALWDEIPVYCLQLDQKLRRQVKSFNLCCLFLIFMFDMNFSNIYLFNGSY